MSRVIRARILAAPAILVLWVAGGNATRVANVSVPIDGGGKRGGDIFYPVSATDLIN